MVAGSNCDQARTCSSDRKRFMVLQAKGSCSPHLRKGTATWPTMPSGSDARIVPSRISIEMSSPQSRHGASTRTVCPGVSQLTASDSKPHWPNQPCWPSMEMRYWVGRLLNGANEAT